MINYLHFTYYFCRTLCCYISFIYLDLALLYEATNSFRVPYIAAGLTIIISALLFLLILCYDWIVYLFTPVKSKQSNTEM